MIRTLSIILATSTTLFGAGSANAGTHWSVGISAPVAGVVVSNGGYYADEPAPFYYQPAPVVRYAPPVVYAPPVEYIATQPTYEPYRGWHGDERWEQRREYEHARWEHARHEREEHRDEYRGRGDDGDSHRWHRD